MKLTVNGANASPKIPASSAVKRIGKYLYRHLDGAFKFQSTGNTFDIYTLVLYQLPRPQQVPGRGPEYNSMHEMTYNISVSTYQNKIRVNTIEVSPTEKTLGFDLFDSEIVTNLEEAKHLILTKVIRRIKNAYKEYDFLF